MADIEKLTENLSGLTVLEVADLVKALEEKWGVSAAAPVAAAAPAGGDGGGEPAEAIIRGKNSKNILRLCLVLLKIKCLFIDFC